MNSTIAALEAIVRQILNTEPSDDYELHQLSAAAAAILTAISALEELES